MNKKDNHQRKKKEKQLKRKKNTVIFILNKKTKTKKQKKIRMYHCELRENSSFIQHSIMPRRSLRSVHASNAGGHG